MITEPLPLWKLLLQTTRSNQTATLTCSDCFAILEYLADIEIVNTDRQILLKTARKHLNACPDCRDYYQRRLVALEQIAQDT